MTNAHAFIATCNALAADVARGAAPATAPVAPIVYRRVRVWPTPESVDWMGEVGPVGTGGLNGWLDSSLDLRDGLSVIEVFAEPVVVDERLEERLH